MAGAGAGEEAALVGDVVELEGHVTDLIGPAINGVVVVVRTAAGGSSAAEVAAEKAELMLGSGDGGVDAAEGGDDAERRAAGYSHGDFCRERYDYGFRHARRRPEQLDGDRCRDREIELLGCVR